MAADAAGPAPTAGGGAGPHAFAPLTFHGPGGPLDTDWCAHFTGPLTEAVDVCGRLADDPVHCVPPEGIEPSTSGL